MGKRDNYEKNTIWTIDMRCLQIIASVVRRVLANVTVLYCWLIREIIIIIIIIIMITIIVISNSNNNKYSNVSYVRWQRLLPLGVLPLIF